MRSVCSSCVVAGSTMSACRAVSVRNCSLTTVNRSSRRRPRSIFACSGATTIGFELNTNSDRIGVGSFISPVSAGPRRHWLSTGVPGGMRSGRLIASHFTGNAQIGMCMMPPPQCRHEPTSAGRHAIARTALPPLALRSIATPMRITDGCSRANPRASFRTSSAAIPVMADTLSGGKPAARSFSSS